MLTTCVKLIATQQLQTLCGHMADESMTSIGFLILKANHYLPPALKCSLFTRERNVLTLNIISRHSHGMPRSVSIPIRLCGRRQTVIFFHNSSLISPKLNLGCILHSHRLNLLNYIPALDSLFALSTWIHHEPYFFFPTILKY